MFCSVCHPLAGYRYESKKDPLINITLTAYLILFNFFVYFIFVVNFNTIDWSYYNIYRINPVGYYNWSVNTNQIFSGELYRLVTGVFLHIDIFHILFNMVLLLFIGYKAENIYGKKYMLVIYVLSGIGGNIASLLAGPFHNSLGSSGAIIGLYGATVKSQDYHFIRKIVFIILFYGIVTLSSGVNMYSHVFGMFSGILLSVFFVGQYHNFNFIFEERGL